METYKSIDACRISGDKNLISVLNLGNQALTGIFPATKTEDIAVAPLELVWSPSSGLLQLNHSCKPTDMYGSNYGYRSSLNRSMIEHLTRKVHYLEKFVKLDADNTVLDIGSNDCTLLHAYSTPNIERIGIDPTGEKFHSFYSKDIKLVANFFNAESYFSVTSQLATIITSIAMFYDLESPIQFAKEIESILDDNGIWHLEQSYMPAMLRLNSYDTICHEHLEYYSLAVINDILKSANLKLVDVTMNDINGGSFSIIATKVSNPIKPNYSVINWLLRQEELMELSTVKPYQLFKERAYAHRNELKNFIQLLVSDGKRILGYGASTKGNVLLQFCGLTTNEIPAIAEVNDEKFGRLTPGTHIPIISEAEAKAMNPDYFLVLPWHFKTEIIRREQEYLSKGGKFIFPFPNIEVM
ncbi:2-polyprenyl-3-methyl-5-hydroxy-6-metoxy-1_4-benzoquinol methylase [Candidatus Rickettsiella viridis]|uniref:2-polyprenyl-3-methyl-5-hydroxy-6-metoxy-1_4-benzoquinol methylase n=1 Tax=Candidatus Rickettsiella viridis TaxID=676208 RepID=A0A2Z5UVP9_9COXI|nr:class I SAM-dependent methyltransferase [Candidatus Rickettsiella viridis]BBB15043.1 2-polyprenyl-3-methyl-5-hydroxy-6-metoxy-1_4-benzoquinol methylase [Candidatus Rickettsiella viridis]